MTRISVLGRTGSDLLFQALRLSTIGAEGFNGRVRYGNGFRPPARTTSPAKDGLSELVLYFSVTHHFRFGADEGAEAAMGIGNENDQDRTSY